MTASLPSEEDLEILVGTCARAHDEARGRLADLILKQTQTKADIKSQSDTLAGERKRLAEDTSLADAEKAATAACAKCGVKSIHDNPHDRLMETIAAAKTSLAETIGKTTEAELLEKKTAEARDLFDRLSKQTETARETVVSADKAIADCRARIATGEALIKSRSEQTAACMGEVDRILGKTQWKTDPHSEMRAFADELERAAAEYADRKNRIADAEIKQREYAAISLNVADSVSAILAMMPNGAWWRQPKETAREPPGRRRSTAQPRAVGNRQDKGGGDQRKRGLGTTHGLALGA